ncbi:MAG: hypothetical protein JST67_11410 [Bacteroidetes bacterium]|nr:hypothetical protein [Bacteroidota bacterium]
MTKQKGEWQTLLDNLAEKFGMQPDIQDVLFLIGVQELGMGYRKFKKHEKVDVMHVAICTLLEPYGYYAFSGRDADGWPHFEVKEQLPFLKPAEQNNLMVRSIIEYFDRNKLND